MGEYRSLSYIAAQRTFPNYNDMADNKAYLESIARSFGYYMGKDKKVRVNTISAIAYHDHCRSRRERLGRIFDLCRKNIAFGQCNRSECADYTVMLFSDFTRKVTAEFISRWWFLEYWS